MRILGIDPGSRVTGWGVIEASGWDVGRVAHGALRLDATAPLASRLHQLAEALADVVTRQRPDVAAVEDVFHARNARAALVLGQARGVVLLVLTQAGLPLFEYAPALVKSSVTGSGRAEKPQVQQALAVQLGMRELPMPLDASDALAIALCHAAESRMKRHLAGMPQDVALALSSRRRRSRGRTLRA